MNQKCFLAGATGAIGSILAPLLIDAGYAVYGSTRRQERARSLEAIGVIPVVVDVFDAPALIAAMARIAPSVVIHQLTDLPPGLSAGQMADAAGRNARLRDLGTYNLVTAAMAAGCTRLVAQSIAWAYAPGPQPFTEQSPLDLTAEGSRAISVGGVAALEKWTLNTAGLIGTVLRYGQLYGPGTGRDTPAGASPVHVEAAATAALLAAQRSDHGIFNIAEPSPDVSSDKARRELGWDPAMRLPVRIAR